MKIVQSFWSLPSASKSVEEGRDKGGWLSIRYHYLGLALSCLLLKRFYSDVELITDESGKSLLIDTLKLPYTSVKVCLDRFNNYPPALWALPKLYSYSIQSEPFLHVDGDVFIWAPFDEQVCDGEVVAQSPEHNHGAVYVTGLTQLQALLGELPPLFMGIDYENICSLNAGVLGGNNIEFIKIYAKHALKIVEDNFSALMQFSGAGNLNIIVEQLLLSVLCQEHDIAPTYIKKKLSNDFQEVLKFELVSGFENYVHLIGFAKKQFPACEQVEMRLRYEFPEYYNDIIEKINQLDIVSAVNSDVQYQESLPKKYFERVQKGLALFTTSKIDVKNITKQKIKNQVNGTVNKKAKKYILEAYELDFVHKSNVLNNWADNKWDNLELAYNLLAIGSKELLMKHPISLASGLNITVLSWPLYTFNAQNIFENEQDDGNGQHYVLSKKIRGQVIEHELVGWNKLLIYFHNNKLDGNALVDELIGVSAVDYTELKDKVFSFICSELVYSGNLVLCKS